MKSLFAVLAAAALVSPPAVAQSQADLLIRHATVVDVERGRVIADQAVVTSGNAIVAVGADAAIATSWKGSQTLDAQDRYLIPGLWDMHVHFGGGVDLIDENRALLPLYVAHGITTVRDASGDLADQVLAWRGEIASGKLFGPTLLSSGPKIEGIKPIWKGTLETGSEADVDAALKKLQALHVDFVKITDSTLKPELFLYAVKHARAAGLKTSGHIPLALTVRQAVDAGLSSIEHLDYAFDAGVKDEAAIAADFAAGRLERAEASRRLDAGFDRATAMQAYRHLAASKVFVTPTLNGGRIIAWLDRDTHENDEYLRYIGPKLRKTYEWRVQRAAQADAAAIAQRHAHYEHVAAVLPMLQQAGVTIMAGTDAGFLNSFNYPGIGLHDELALYVAKGLTPLQALSAATRAGPAWFGKLDGYGAISAGKSADLVLLDRNPLQDISATRAIRAVILRGTLHDRAALDRMLADAQAKVAAWNVEAGEPTASRPPADVLIRGGRIYTGADVPSFVGDVVVTADKIVYVGPDGAQHFAPRRIVEASNRIVAPGFIDAHTHPDTYIRSDDPAQRVNAPWLMQGATTLLVGVDGAGTPDVAQESAAYAGRKIGTNLVPYVGFSAVRTRVLQQQARAPTPQELDRMRALVAKGMCEGAIGFSTGLFYAPQSFATTAEVIALAKEAAVRGGIYDTHQRDESSYSIGLLKSVAEVLRIGRDAGLPVHFAHIKALGTDVQGQAPQVIAAIEAARAAGQQVTADQYPWAASGTALDPALLPAWAQDGGDEALLQRLASDEVIARLLPDMRDNLRRRGGAQSLLLTSAGTPWAGKTLAQVASEWNVEPVQAALRIILSSRSQGTSAVSFNMSEDDIRLFMRQPWIVTSSDGSDGHPRQYATFPTKYTKYVLEQKTISIDEFVRSSTGRTAELFKLDRRGRLAPGYFADIVVFDPARYAPRADYQHPQLLSQGVDELFVNGQQAIRARELTGEAAGRVLLRPTPAGCP